MSSRHALVRSLASSLLAGPWTATGLRERAAHALGGGPPRPAALVERLLARFGEGHAPHPRALERVLAADAPCIRAWKLRHTRGLPLRWVLSSPVMEEPIGGLSCPGMPPIATTGELAALLEVPPRMLDWLADCQGRNDRLAPGPLTHYHYRWRPREGRPPRLIEIPKARLKRIQRWILREILDRVPAHPAAHGFRHGRSCLTYARPHLGRAVVARLDLTAFFQSIGRRRVLAVFRSLGYPYPVARALTGLCVHAVTAAELGPMAQALPWPDRRRLATPHLPQGAPTSPALANLIAYRLDCRLAGLAAKRDLAYTRYADDLAFSGDTDLARGFDGLHALVAHIAADEGFSLNTRKTRLMTQAMRQRLAGVVVNGGGNLARDEYDRLKAILFNCVRWGPGGQNRDGHVDFRAHITGRVGHAASLNPAKGAKLWNLLRQIDWNASPSPSSPQ